MSVRSAMLIGLAVAAWGVMPASGEPLGVPPGRFWDRPRVAEVLGLSAEQRQKLDATALEHARAMIDLKAAVDRAELDLRALADEDTIQPGKIRQAFAALQQARSRLESERFDMLLKVRETLTADQWRRLKEIVKRLGERLERGAEGGADVPNQQRPRRWRP